MTAARSFYVAEMDPVVTDEDVLNMANQRNALLVTADKDFGKLIFRQKRIRAGVLLVRLAGLSPERKSDIVSTALREHGPDLIGAFSVLSAGAIRIRKGL